jgi:hypothetical protein
MRRIVLTFGLISGGIMSGLMALAMVFKDEIGFDAGMAVGYTSMVLSLLLVYFGVRAYRDNVGGGMLTFGQGMKVGLLISVVSTLCYVATWEVIYRTVAPDYMEKYAVYQVEKDRKAGKSEAELAASQKEMAEMVVLYKNFFVRAGLTFLEPSPVVLVMCLVSAGLLRRQARPTPA